MNTNVPTAHLYRLYLASQLPGKQLNIIKKNAVDVREWLFLHINGHLAEEEFSSHNDAIKLAYYFTIVWRNSQTPNVISST